MSDLKFLEDMHINEGDIIGLHNGKVEFKADNVHDVALRLMETIKSCDVIKNNTLYADSYLQI